MTRFTTLEGCPPALVLHAINILEPILTVFLGPQWRNRMPFGLGVDGGLLSHELPESVQKYFPTLLSYSDFLMSNAKGNANAGNYNYNYYSLSNLYKYLFKTPNTALGDVTSTESLIALTILVLLLRCFKRNTHPIFCSIGRRLAIQTHGEKWVKVPSNQEKIIKFGEYVFRFLYHFSVSVYGLYYFWDKPWWDWSGIGSGSSEAAMAAAAEATSSWSSWPWSWSWWTTGNETATAAAVVTTGTTLLFRGYPNHDIDVGMAWYYLLQCAYNVDAFISLVELSFDFDFGFNVPFLHSKNDKDDGKLNDEKKDPNLLLSTNPIKISWSSTVRGDFPEMMIHHIITNSLVFASSYFRFTRVGSMVFLIHDISDVPIDMSKLANFVKWTKTTVVCFVSMVIIWTVTRMTILPFVIVKSVWCESHLVFSTSDDGWVGMMDARTYRMHFGYFFALLCGITALHYFWFGIFIRIARDLTKGKVQDYSEHKKGEPEAETETASGSGSGTKSKKD